VTVTRQILASADDVNEDGSSYDPAEPNIWLGTNTSALGSFSAFRFQDVPIPPGATIVSAELEVRAAENDWTLVDMDFFAEAADNCLAFSNGQRPSGRPLTQGVPYSKQEQWFKNTWYSLSQIDAPVKSVLSRSGWKSGNAICIIIHGTGATGAIKKVTSFDGFGPDSARLNITYIAP